MSEQELLDSWRAAIAATDETSKAYAHEGTAQKGTTQEEWLRLGRLLPKVERQERMAGRRYLAARDASVAGQEATGACPHGIIGYRCDDCGKPLCPECGIWERHGDLLCEDHNEHALRKVTGWKEAEITQDTSHQARVEAALAELDTVVVDTTIRDQAWYWHVFQANSHCGLALEMVRGES